MVKKKKNKVHLAFSGKEKEVKGVKNEDCPRPTRPCRTRERIRREEGQRVPTRKIIMIIEGIKVKNIDTCVTINTFIFYYA